MSSRRRVWPTGARWLTAGIVAVVLALVVAWVLFVPAADWLARHDVGFAHGALLQTARDDARGRLLTLGAGLLAASALMFTARNFALSRRTFELTEQGQVTERYTKAIEQLGSDKLDVRIGGIYALERVARDSVRDQPTVMEVLTAFIREHSREPWPEPKPGGQEQDRSTRPDVQAAVTVVGRRDPARDVQRVELSQANLTGANLSGANLSQATLTDATLTHATLSRANLTDANLVSTDLSGAKLTNAFLARANLSGANLSQANLFGANLTHANLSQANLSGADLFGADLTDAFLTRANLSGANLTQADLTDTNLSGADLPNTTLSGANLTGANLTGANLTDANLTSPIFGGPILTGAAWPRDKAVPRGWKRNPNSIHLTRES